MGPRHPHGVELAAVTLHAAADRFGHQIGDLLAADLHIRQPLAGQQQLGGQGVGLLLEAAAEGFARFAMVEGGAGDGHALVGGEQLVGREADGEAVEEVVTHRSLLGVVGGDQQAAAGMGEAQALPLDPVLARAHRRQQQVGDLVVEQVELVDVEHPAVRLGQQAGLEHRRPGGEGGGHIHGTHQPVLAHPQRHLHERGRFHPGGQQGCAIGAAGVTPSSVMRWRVAASQSSGRLGSMCRAVAPPPTSRLSIGGSRACRPRASTDFPVPRPRRSPPPQSRVHRRQQQGQFEGAVAGDRRQGKGAGGLLAGSQAGGGTAGAAGDHGERMTLGSGSLADGASAPGAVEGWGPGARRAWIAAAAAGTADWCWGGAMVVA